MHYSRWRTTGSLELVERPKQQRRCEVGGCDKPHFGQGLCNMHYSRQRRHGDVAITTNVWYYGGACSVEGCEEPCKSQALCSRHYQRMRLFGQVELPDRRKTCSVDGCERNGGASRMCEMHRRRLAKHGDVEALRRNSSPPATCTMEGCGRPYLASGMCSRHLDAHYRATNPGRFAAAGARRRLGEQNGMTRTDRAESARYRNLNLGSPCAYCGEPADTSDHIKAISSGGTDHWWNLAACCKSCNSSKGGKELLEFLIFRLGGGTDERTVPA